MRKETPSTAVRSPYRRTRSSTTRTSSGDASAEGRRRSGARFVVTGHRHHRWGASSWHGRPLGREDLLLISGDRAIHVTGVVWGRGASSRRRALPAIGGRAPGVVSDRCGLPGLLGVAALAGWLRVSGLRPRRGLAAR